MFPPPKRWADKYRCALRGLVVAVRNEDSFWVHLPAAVAVVVCGVWLRVSFYEWLLLAVCIGVVISAELFNTALEHLAKAVTREQNEHVRDALDVAAAAVMAAAVMAALVGAAIFAVRLFG